MLAWPEKGRACPFGVFSTQNILRGQLRVLRHDLLDREAIRQAPHDQFRTGMRVPAIQGSP